MLKYRGHLIKAIEHARPFLIDGFPVSHGYVVTKNGANVMSGATWFQTVRSAARAVDALIDATSRSVLHDSPV